MTTRPRPNNGSGIVMTLTIVGTDSWWRDANQRIGGDFFACVFRFGRPPCAGRYKCE